MARKYTMLDLIRFAKFSKENEGVKPIERLKAYNAKFPELSARQKWENVRKYLGDELGDEIERVVAESSNESSALPLADVTASLPDSTKEMLAEIISWEKDLSEYESLESILRRKYIISKRQ